MKAPAHRSRLSGHGNHGTIVGNPAWVDGFYGSALLFNTGK
jgi:hypothetical protein